MSLDHRVRVTTSRPTLRGRRGGVTATRAGADFLVVLGRLTDTARAALCDSDPVPVYAAQITMESAWAFGDRGVNEVSG